MAKPGRWRYIAQRMTGDGPGEFIDFNVPLQNVSINELLSGHNALSGTITPEYARLKGPDGRPILEEDGCALWAESPGGEIWGGLLTRSQLTGPTWSIECNDLTSISIGLPYTDANFWIGVDPIDLYRYIWTWIQQQPGGNVGIDVDFARSPKRLGDTMIQRVEFDLEPDPSSSEPEVITIPTQPNPFVNNEEWVQKGIKAMKAVGWTPSVVEAALRTWLAKLNDTSNPPPMTEQQKKIRDKVIQKIGLPPNPPPPRTGLPTTTYVLDPREPPGSTEPPVVWEYDAYKLAWYKDHDLSQVMDQLATETPFDWHLTHAWSDASDEDAQIRHNIRIAWPRLGRRVNELRFVVGENISVVPEIERDGAQHANEVLFLGAGEGSAQVVARAYRPDGKVRRVAVLSDPSVSTTELAYARAQQELAKRVVLDEISELVLRDHPHAPVGSVRLGDDILIEGQAGWVDIETWVRVIGRTISPDSADTMRLTVIRSDRLS